VLESGLRLFPDFVAEHKKDLAAICDAQNIEAVRGENGQNDFDNIRKSFSQEWSIFDYDADKTWGWTLQERKEVFLGDVQFKPENLRGRRMLDAGCGNGTLTAALSDFGMEIVGLDLNDGLGRAYANRDKYAKNAAKLVQYIQGNIVNPPLREGAFDLIYSSGVIHHTPNSKDAFTSLVKLTKKGGRLYVWVYGKRSWPVRLFFRSGQGLKHWMTLKSVMRVCRLLAPVYKVAADLLNGMGIMSFRRRNTREITLDLFDGFAPRFNHWHTEAEVRSWFEENDFQNIHVSGIQKHGFGMYGDKC
jgi:ubiquinone/menaquinone biosynthesis C-methylase UbiE